MIALQDLRRREKKMMQKKCGAKKEFHFHVGNAPISGSKKAR